MISFKSSMLKIQFGNACSFKNDCIVLRSLYEFLIKQYFILMCKACPTTQTIKVDVKYSTVND